MHFQHHDIRTVAVRADRHGDASRLGGDVNLDDCVLCESGVCRFDLPGGGRPPGQDGYTVGVEAEAFRLGDHATDQVAVVVQADPSLHGVQDEPFSVRLDDAGRVDAGWGQPAAPDPWSEQGV